MTDRAAIIINPIRVRIIQFTARNQPVTVARISEAMPDVSKATLYRHIRILTANGILHVVGEEKIRGAYEQSFSLIMEQVLSTGKESNDDVQALVYSILMKLVSDFTQYFSEAPVNPIEDKLFIGTNTLYLDDGEFDAFTKEVYSVVEKYSLMKASSKGKMRMITLVSSPVQREEETDE